MSCGTSRFIRTIRSSATYADMYVLGRDLHVPAGLYAYTTLGGGFHLHGAVLLSHAGAYGVGVRVPVAPGTFRSVYADAVHGHSRVLRTSAAFEVMEGIRRIAVARYRKVSRNSVEVSDGS